MAWVVSAYSMHALAPCMATQVRGLRARHHMTWHTWRMPAQHRRQLQLQHAAHLAAQQVAAAAYFIMPMGPALSISARIGPSSGSSFRLFILFSTSCL